MYIIHRPENPRSAYIVSVRFRHVQHTSRASAVGLALRFKIVCPDGAAAFSAWRATVRPSTTCPTVSGRGWRDARISGKHRDPSKGQRPLFVAAANRMGQSFARRWNHHFRKSAPHRARHQRAYLSGALVPGPQEWKTKIAD